MGLFSRDVAIYWASALVVVAGVAIWLWATAPPEDTLPDIYQYGVK